MATAEEVKFWRFRKTTVFLAVVFSWQCAANTRQNTQQDFLSKIVGKV
jgi:hypothetical protein